VTNAGLRSKTNPLGKHFNIASANEPALS
jgi:hypothetical protein